MAYHSDMTSSIHILAYESVIYLEKGVGNLHANMICLTFFCLKVVRSFSSSTEETTEPDQRLLTE